jgi:hypothetical protein
MKIVAIVATTAKPAGRSSLKADSVREQRGEI